MKDIEYGLPKDKLFFKIADIKNLGLMSKEKAKLEIYAKRLQAIKNGRNWLIPRAKLIEYIETYMVQ